jgi:uncharacterized membrane protein YidH (DUF202 family)
MADSTHDPHAETRIERRDLLLWFSVLAGPFAWALTEQLSYMLTPTACWTGRHVILHLVPLSTLLIVLAGALVARGRWKRQPPEGSTERGNPEDSRVRFMALAGFWLCVSFALAILAMEIPNLVLRACD